MGQEDAVRSEVVPIRLPDGGEGELLRLEGERALVRVPVPWATGQPVAFEALLGATSLSLRGRCQGARRIGPERFEARLRLVNLSRQQRQALQAALRGEGVEPAAEAPGETAGRTTRD